MVCGPGGYFKYEAATRYSHGTAEDTLQFVPSNSAAPRYAVWFPGKTALQVRSEAARIAWTDSGTNCVLEFPGPAGSLRQLRPKTQ